MNGLTKLFIIVIVVACSVISCADPIGSIGGGSGEDGKLEAIPKKQHYNLTEVFIRDYDLTVFKARRGILYYIPIDEVEIYVIEDRVHIMKAHLCMA